MFIRDLGPTEVGGFGLSATDDLLLIEDFMLVRQVCTEFTVLLDDAAVADHFDELVDQGKRPEQFGRIWVHTHPGDSPTPSATDESTFSRCFCSADWSLMFVVARGGRTYARQQFRVGPGGQMTLPVEIDFIRPFPATASDQWKDEYERCVRVECNFVFEREQLKPRPSADPFAADELARFELEFSTSSILWPMEPDDDRPDPFL